MVGFDDGEDDGGPLFHCFPLLLPSNSYKQSDGKSGRDAKDQSLFSFGCFRNQEDACELTEQDDEYQLQRPQLRFLNTSEKRSG